MSAIRVTAECDRNHSKQDVRFAWVINGNHVFKVASCLAFSWEFGAVHGGNLIQASVNLRWDSLARYSRFA